jgi:two-component system, response regulator, stage 0 sporulation protein A
MMKNKLKLFIADDNEEYCASLMREAEHMTNHFEIIGCAHNGLEAIRYITGCSPDVVILDIIMPVMDGFSVIKSINHMQPKPKVVVISVLGSDVITQQAIRLGADYFICKPVKPSYVMIRLLELFGYEDDTPAPSESVPVCKADEVSDVQLDRAIRDVLHHLSFDPSLQGFQYLRELIRMVVRENRLIDAVTKKLYPHIAGRFNTTPSRVERSVRYAIETAWDRGDIDRLNSYFGYSISSERGKPTNSEFIAMVADRIELTP